MNNINKLIAKFENNGIHLFIEGGKLRYKAPKELMTAEVLAELKANKTQLMEALEKKSNENAFIIDRTNRYEPFPLTDVQSAYLLGRNELFEYGGVACHVYLEIKYPELDSSKVAEIWNKLVAKYDMLHAIIDEGGFQQVLKEIPRLEVPTWDLITNPNHQAEYEHFTKEMGSRAYTIGKWPMFGIAVSKHKDYSILHFSIEFLIADWTSIWKLVAEFEGAYFDGREIEGEEEISFRDYLVAEKKIKATPQYEKEKKYWMDRIADLPEAPDLPKLSANEDKKCFNRKFLRLSKDEWDGFKAKAKQYGLTPTVPVLASYADVLAKWSTNKRFCINMTVLNRLPLHEKVMDIVGDFTSLSLLALDCNKNDDFLSRAKRANAQLFADLDNRLFSGVEVMREFSRQSKKSGISMPIVYTSAIGLADSGTPLRGDFIGGISQTPQTFIDCQVMDGAFGLQVNWDYREGVFPEGVLNSMFEAFENRLHELAISENWENIKDIALPARDAEERKAANDTQKDWNVRMLQDDFIESVKRTPKKIAIDDSAVKFTFEELDARAKVLADQLMTAGVKPQDCVPVLMEKSAWQAVAVFGILYAGAIYVPVAANKAKGRAEKIVKKTKAKVAIGISSDEAILEGELFTINVDTLSANIFAVDCSRFPKRTPDDIAYIIYTSGSTGEPKGVVITHEGAMNTIDDMNNRFGVTANDAVLGLSQLNFDLSVYDIFGVLGIGGTVYYPPSAQYMNPEYWESLILEKNITVWNSVPALMKMLLNYEESKTNAKPLPFKNAFLSGDWIPLDMPDLIQKHAPNCEVICLGGATEASIWSNYHRHDKNDGLKILPYGKPLANQTMHILDENLQDCPIMVSGQIALGGNGVALGYYLDAERTSAQFVNLPSTGEHVYLTGDLGRYLPGGEIEFLGRKDNQVKIRGHRIELGEIENVFKEHPQIADAAAVVNASKSEINVMLELSDFSIDKQKLTEELNDYMERFLLNYMHPSHIEMVEKMPLSANGKIDRKAIQSFFESQKTEAKKNKKTCNAQESELETRIRELWSKTLNEPNLDSESNFYDYGADSLLMAQVATSIKNDLKQDKPFDALLKQMLDHPTVRETVEYLTNNEKGKSKSANGNFLKLVRYGKPVENKLRVVLPAIFWNADKFKSLISLLEEQDEGEIYTFAMEDAEAYEKLKPEEVGSKLAELFTQYVLDSKTTQVQIITYCFISPIGIEMAERLIDAGIKVEDLSIIDGSRLGFKSETSFLKKVFFAEMLGTDLKTWGLDPEECVTLFQEELKNSNKKKITDEDILALSNKISQPEKLKEFLDLDKDGLIELCKKYNQGFVNAADDATIRRLYALFDQGMNVMLNYTPAPYFGDIRYFKAKNDEGIYRYFDILYNEWEELCLGEFNLLPIPGNHFSCLSEPEYVKAVADMLSLKKGANG